MKTIPAYSFHPETGVYVGETVADESPLEPGVYLFPANSTGIEPPAFDAQTERARWDGEAWIVEAIPEPEPDLEPTAPSVEELIAYAKRVRDEKEQGGFIYNGWRFDSDPISATRINGAAIAASSALMAEQPFSIDWTDADDEVRTLDAAGVLAMQQALVVHADACHQFCKSVIADIVAGTITTVDEIDSADWPA